MADESAQRKGWLDLIPRHITPEQWDKVRNEFAKGLEAQERVQGIVFMCRLDDALERLLRTVMIDDKSVNGLMADGQALQPFSIKLRLAYALGLISERIRKDLYFLNKIRNAFAHEADITSFDKAPVCDLCRNLSTATEEPGQGETPRDIYRIAVFDSSLYLEYEADRRAKKKESLQRPAADMAESLVLAWFEEQEFRGPHT